MKRSGFIRRKKPMKRTGFKRESYNGILDLLYKKITKPRKRKRIRTRSKKREGADLIYKERRAVFLATNPKCEVSGCTSQSTEVHHKARRGKFYLRVDTWMPVCSKHHKQIEENGAWAKANGYTLTPEQRRLLS